MPINCKVFFTETRVHQWRHTVHAAKLQGDDHCPPAVCAETLELGRFICLEALTIARQDVIVYFAPLKATHMTRGRAVR